MVAILSKRLFYVSCLRTEEVQLGRLGSGSNFSLDLILIRDLLLRGENLICFIQGNDLVEDVWIAIVLPLLRCVKIILDICL